MTADEQSWNRGYRGVATQMLRHALDMLGHEGSEAEHVRWISEREEAVAALRRVCEDHGDNDWADGLNLSDVIEKHLARHLGG